VTFSAKNPTAGAPPPLTVCRRCFQGALAMFKDLVGADWVDYAPGEVDARLALQNSYRAVS
jgi:hypothetical protein